jgi:hypothetical protein
MTSAARITKRATQRQRYGCTSVAAAEAVVVIRTPSVETVF